jgi:hypothetical protein
MKAGLFDAGVGEVENLVKFPGPKSVGSSRCLPLSILFPHCLSNGARNPIAVGILLFSGITFKMFGNTNTKSSSFFG